MELASPIDVIGHYCCYYIMCNDQFVNIFQIDQVVSKYFGVFCVKTLNVQANFAI